MEIQAYRVPSMATPLLSLERKRTILAIILAVMTSLFLGTVMLCLSLARENGMLRGALATSTPLLMEYGTDSAVEQAESNLDILGRY